MNRRAALYYKICNETRPEESRSPFLWNTTLPLGMAWTKVDLVEDDLWLHMREKNGKPTIYD